MLEAVIFDFDGVLINSVPASQRVRKRLLATYGVDLDSLPDPHHEGNRATSTKNLLALVRQHCRVVIDEAEFTAQAAAEIAHELRHSGLQAHPELVRLLKELRAHNVPRAIATSGQLAGTTTKLEILGIRPYFSVIVNGSEVVNHKPDSEVYDRAIRQLGAQPARCVAIEDSAIGVQAAVSAGCKVVGQNLYNANKTPIPGAHLTVNTWADLRYTKLRALVIGRR